MEDKERNSACTRRCTCGECVIYVRRDPAVLGPRYIRVQIGDLNLGEREMMYEARALLHELQESLEMFGGGFLGAIVGLIVAAVVSHYGPTLLCLLACALGAAVGWVEWARFARTRANKKARQPAGRLIDIANSLPRAAELVDEFIPTNPTVANALKTERYERLLRQPTDPYRLPGRWQH